MRNECIYVGIFNMMGNGEHQNQTRHFLRYPVFREKKHLQHFFRNMMSWGAQCDHSLKYGMVREVWTWIGAFDPAFYPLAVGV